MSTTSDDITANFDPIIGGAYEEYLVQGVLANYASKERPFRPLREIERNVIEISNSLAGISLLNKDD